MNTYLPQYKVLKESWRNRIFDVYMFFAMVIFAIELVLGLLAISNDSITTSAREHINTYVILPVCANVAIILIAYAICKYAKSEKLKDYSIIFAIFAICFMITSLHGYYLVLPGIFVLPIVISIMLDDINVTRVSALISLIFMFITVPTGMHFDSNWDFRTRIWGAVTGSIILLSVYLICEVLARFTQTRNNLISVMETNNNQMKLAMKLDAMTGLYNHSEFYENLKTEVAECVNNNKKLAIALIDVDNFKKVNDKYGHEKGDKVLLMISAILKAFTVSEGRAYRYGGEEFALIMPGFDSERAMKLVENIRLQVWGTRFDFLDGIGLTISSGICEYGGEEINEAKIIEKAEQAMFESKYLGRNTSVLYNREEQAK